MILLEPKLVGSFPLMIIGWIYSVVVITKYVGTYMLGIIEGNIYVCI